MAVPKAKISKQKKRSRRSHHSLTALSLRKCSHCGSFKVPHKVCPSCGHYKGKAILEIT